MLSWLARLRVHSDVGPQLTRMLSDVAKLTDKGIQVDGRELLHIETRNLCRCEQCFGKYSHQRGDLPFVGNKYPGVKVESIGRISEHYLGLKWSDGHEGLIGRTLRGDYGAHPIDFRLTKWLDLSLRKNAEQKFWDTPDEEVSKFWDYSWVVENSDNTREFLVHYMKYGIGFLSGIPNHLGMLDVVEEGLQMSPVKRTCFNKVDLVRFKPNPNNTGYGSGRLPAHTDLPFFDQVYFKCMAVYVNLVLFVSYFSLQHCTYHKLHSF